MLVPESDHRRMPLREYLCGARRLRLWGLGLLATPSGIARITRFRTHALRDLKASGLFDADHYTGVAGVNGTLRELRLHYLTEGARKGSVPHPMFDARYYRQQYGARLGVADPFLHYLLVGRHLDLMPNAWFDPASYRAANPDLALGELDPLAHAAQRGLAEGRWITSKPPATLPDTSEWDDVEAQQPAGEPVVDIVMPVYRGRAETLRAIWSVLKAQNETAAQLIVINDASPDQLLTSELAALAKRFPFQLIVHARNEGFVASVNRGLAVNTQRDAVILNADTEVFDGWLDRLRRAAREDARIATVTPLTNAGTIVSYPIPLRDNHAPLEVSAGDLDRLALASDAAAVRVPTGVGFCMYISRACVKALGSFDHMAFGQGYGEENDFCQRAAEAGWLNIAAPNVFVRHHGSASFGAERARRAENAMRILQQRHPDYVQQLARFVASDPLRPARVALDVARLRRAAQRFWLVHGQLRQDISMPADVALLPLRRDPLPPNGRLRFAHPIVQATPNLPDLVPGSSLRDVAESCRALRVERILLGTDPHRDGQSVAMLHELAAQVPCLLEEPA